MRHVVLPWDSSGKHGDRFMEGGDDRGCVWRTRLDLLDPSWPAGPRQRIWLWSGIRVGRRKMRVVGSWARYLWLRRLRSGFLWLRGAWLGLFRDFWPQLTKAFTKYFIDGSPLYS